jgi:hypothetical protein
MRIVRVFAVYVLFFLLLLPAVGAYAGAPTDEMKQTTDKVLE